MSEESIHVLSIAGFDPSGGAGILADIKTIEANKVSGMGVVSALTFQNDSEFDGVNWVETENILRQIHTLQRKFSFHVIKIGIIKDLSTLEIITDDLISQNPNVQIIWDPIVSASAGFEFHTNFEREKLFQLLKKFFLITPNTKEAEFLTGFSDSQTAGKKISEYCNVLLKGGHNDKEPGVDYLFTKNEREKFLPEATDVFQKHGSGCVLSSSIAVQLAKGMDLTTACRNAKKYTERFLTSNKTLLGVHYA
jgi:hydroxymethylpyrimidine/phosphomethylpyrimidine kinase